MDVQVSVREPRLVAAEISLLSTTKKPGDKRGIKLSSGKVKLEGTKLLTARPILLCP